jgi:hypothetical protein
MKRLFLLSVIFLICVGGLIADEDTPYFDEYFSETSYPEEFSPPSVLKYKLGWMAYDLEHHNLHRLPLYMNVHIVGEESFFPRFPELFEYNNPEIIAELFWTFASIKTEDVEQFSLLDIKRVTYRKVTKSRIEMDVVLFDGTEVTVLFGYMMSDMNLYAAIG